MAMPSDATYEHRLLRDASAAVHKESSARGEKGYGWFAVLFLSNKHWR